VREEERKKEKKGEKRRDRPYLVVGAVDGILLFERRH
jgi:hypothetical protein